MKVKKQDRGKEIYVNNVNALGYGNQHVNKLNDFNILYAIADSLPNKLDELNKGNNKITEHRAILLKSQQTDKISQQPENWENCNGPDQVQAFPKKWWVESDFTAPNLSLPLQLKGSVVIITVFLTILGENWYNSSQRSTYTI